MKNKPKKLKDVPAFKFPDLVTFCVPIAFTRQTTPGMVEVCVNGVFNLNVSPDWIKKVRTKK